RAGEARPGAAPGPGDAPRRQHPGHRQADLDRERRRHRDGQHPAQGRVRQRRRRALARTVRGRAAAPGDARRRARGAGGRRATRPGRRLRLRRRPADAGHPAAGRGRPQPRHRGRHSQRPGTRRAGRGRRPAAAGERDEGRGEARLTHLERRPGLERHPGLERPRGARASDDASEGPGRHLRRQAAAGGESGPRAMSISEPFIRRPVATILIMVAIAFFGVLAFVRLPVSALPNVDFPTIQVSAQLPGASAETMAASVATPLEREFSTIDGLDSMTSSSSLGATQVTLRFSSDRDLDSAAQDVQSALSRASRRLPPDMPSPPYYRKVNPADQPILYLSLSSDVLPTHQVNEYAETDLAQRISTISGVAQVMVYGSQKYAVRIQVDPDALVNRGIGIDQVAEAIRGGNSNSPTGTLYGASKAFTIQ